ncbi:MULTISPECIES: hypothetical protein [unclassified Paenibacillus]|uniref:hypothetical protein n=1 Tax=unclassified Paenibacillus TaxID=185978 RepID=UPI00115FF090|nr:MULTISPECIES: hypothetical protein [unclassified Paenibacillus]
MTRKEGLHAPLSPGQAGIFLQEGRKSAAGYVFIVFHTLTGLAENGTLIERESILNKKEVDACQDISLSGTASS